MRSFKSFVKEEKPGLYANIHAKRARIKAGSGEKMRKPGSEGAPTTQDWKDAAKTAKEEVEIDELNQMTLSRYAAKARAQSMDKNNPKRYKRGSGAAQAYDKLNRGDYSEEVEIEEAVSVKKQNYSWGKMVTVHHGSDTSYPLHPEHQAKIKSLKDGEKTSFKDETKRTVTAHREGDKVHLSGAGSSKKTTVAHSHFAEEVEPIDELSKATLASYAKKAVTDARFKQGIGKDYEALGKRKRDPETKAMFARMGRKVRMKAQSREQGAAKAIDRLAKEEVEIEEAQDINYHRAELKKTSDKIDSIVKGGGKVGLNDPLSKKLKLHSAQIKKMKEEVEITEVSKELLSRYKEKAGAQASNLNKAVDAVATSSAAPEHKKAAIDALVKKGNKRYSGIIKATNKQFAKEEKDKDDVPFTPDKPKTPSAKAGKYGIGYSTAKHLARMALAKQKEKQKESK